MKSVKVRIARIYITEASHQLEKILLYLQNEVHIRGVSVFRAISGYGEHGGHSAHLVDLSLSLPLVIEFFDEPSKVEQALDHLVTLVKSEHMVCWDAMTLHR